VNAQPSLFDDLTARARRSDPSTSHAAARSVKRIRASHAAILACFQQHGPMHDEKLQELYGQQPPLSQSGLRTRRSELVDRDLLRDSGKRTKTRFNRETIIWELASERRE
jgi:hypothetical protein